MILTKEQKHLLKKWVRLNRKVYNLAMESLNQHQGFDRTRIGGTGKQAFKTFFNASIRPQWLKDELPATILDRAVMVAYSAWSKTKRNPKYIGKGKDKKLHHQAGLKIAIFRSIPNQSQTLQFKVASDFKSGKNSPKYWGELPSFECYYNGRMFCVLNPDYTPEVTYKNGNFYLNLPEDETVKDNGKEGFIAFDPGVITFRTGFDRNRFLEFGEGNINRMVRLCRSLDKPQSLRDLAKEHKNRHLRYRISQQMKRKRRRNRNLVDEMHRKVASRLAQNYRGIALPTYESSQMVCKSKRKIRSKTARSMLTWAMYRFSQVLECQCPKYGSILTRHPEEYTSKTCPHCGHVHQKLGGRKQFTCPSCGFSLKRDYVGALGNFLKALWDTTVLTEVRSDCLTFTVNVEYCPVVKYQ